MFHTKFKAIIFYKDEDRLNKYLEKYKDATPIKAIVGTNNRLYIYEHFEIRCIKSFYFEGCKAVRCDFILIQEEIQEEYNYNDFIDYVYKPILKPMLANQKFNIDVKYF